MPGPSRDATKANIGPADLYFAPGDTAKPADTVLINAISTPWVPVGFSDEGVTLNAETDLEKHYAEEQATPIKVTVNSRELYFAADLLEDTVETIKLVLGSGAIATQAAASGVIGKKTLTLADDLTTYAMLMESRNPAGFWRRIWIPRGVIVGSIETSFRRSDSMVAWHLEFHSISGTAEISLVDQTALALP